jgi:hypothetical protein
MLWMGHTTWLRHALWTSLFLHPVPPMPLREWVPFSTLELSEALNACARNSSPGPDHVTWSYLKYWCGSKGVVFSGGGCVRAHWWRLPGGCCCPCLSTGGCGGSCCVGCGEACPPLRSSALRYSWVSLRLWPRGAQLLDLVTATCYRGKVRPPLCSTPSGLIWGLISGSHPASFRTLLECYGALSQVL